MGLSSLPVPGGQISNFTSAHRCPAMVGWSTIESDPGVFTQLSHDLGIRGTQVEEIVTMEDLEFSQIAPVYGLIFLFKWTQDMAVAHRTAATCVENSNMYFAKQVINNACGTQALLNIMMNAEGIHLGEQLSQFKAFTMDFPPDLRGESMSNSEMIRSAHNSFARPEPFEMEERKATKEDDVYHFTAYMPFEGNLYELDGLQDGPILLGPCKDSSTWWTQVRPMIQERIEKYAANEIRFNLLAVCRNQRLHALQCISQQCMNSELIRAALLSHGIEETEDMMQDSEDIADFCPEPIDLGGLNVEQLRHKLADCRSQISELQLLAAREDEKMAAYRRENARRRHNFIPFIIELLKLLAEKQKLQPLIDAATQKTKAKAGSKA